jgi:two-component system invasion response regulator UvrY
MAYLNKAADPQTIVQAVRTVATGRKYITPEIAQALADSVTTRSRHRARSALRSRDADAGADRRRTQAVRDRRAAVAVAQDRQRLPRTRAREAGKLSSNAEIATYAMRNKLIDLGPVD